MHLERLAENISWIASRTDPSRPRRWSEYDVKMLLHRLLLL